ncbi:TylF/MycF/NovP-related O-methyltransferase [Burkholderia ambifaria]|uniref:TylF/MycF/NovP-related O-methyltransferase n=1 Tax=Burkholderia ambifaria TaxID=152480 RepID=UPI00158866EE|nr:TylF/MycF/NovP-related O-methyltransferase [Burkholderia ambifaria]
MDNKIIYQLADDNANMSDLDRLVNLYWAFSSVLFSRVPGDVVELGCNAGKTTVFFRMILDYYKVGKTIHVYDSFEGLPAPGERDAYLREGDCRCTASDLKETFKKWDRTLPEIHKGWFDKTLPEQLPDQIAFAYLDGDFYESIKISLETIYPRLANGAIVIVDDYCDLKRAPRSWNGLPGVKVACDEFERKAGVRFSALCGIGDLSFGMLRKEGND